MERERRMLSNRISTSRKVNELCDQAALLYTWLLPRVDDEGRMEGDPETVRAIVFPMRKISAEEIDTHLRKMSEIKLILYYEEKSEDGRKYIEILNFNEFQTFHGVRRYPSKIPTFSSELHNWLSSSLEHQTAPNFTNLHPTAPDPGTFGEYKLKEDKINKEKVNKDKINKTKEEKEEEKEEKFLSAEPIPTKQLKQEIINFWNEVKTEDLPRVIRLSTKRSYKFSKRLKENPDLATWKKTIRRICASDFCNGNNDRGWKASFDFLINNEEGILKVLEGRYDNHGGKYAPKLCGWLNGKQITTDQFDAMDPGTKSQVKETRYESLQIPTTSSVEEEVLSEKPEEISTNVEKGT